MQIRTSIIKIFNNIKLFIISLGLLVKKILINLFFGIILGIIIINKNGFNIINGWKMDYNEILTNYLKVLLSLPAVILYITIIFFCRFKKSINFFIRHLIIKYKGIEATTQQSNKPKEKPPEDISNEDTALMAEIKISPTEEKPDVANINVPTVQVNPLSNEENVEKISELKEENQRLLDMAQFFKDRSDFFEFRDLDRILVEHTKSTLLFLNKIAPVPFTDFMKYIIIIPKTVENIEAEKASIFEILITGGLINNKENNITITDKGKLYIEHLEKIKNGNQ